jgi:hypothetical protein
MPVFIVIPLVAFKRGGLLAWHAQGALQTRFFSESPDGRRSIGHAIRVGDCFCNNRF